MMFSVVCCDYNVIGYGLVVKQLLNLFNVPRDNRLMELRDAMNTTLDKDLGRCAATLG
jgi:hypothetical protein